LYAPTLETVVMEFDKIPEAILNDEVVAGLLIHESQVTFKEEGLYKIRDLGEWWHETTGLVLPLGCNGIKRDLGDALIQKICRVLYRSVKWALDNRAEALAGCQQYARDLAPEKVDKFVGMYVNDLTLEITPEIRKAVHLMLKLGYENGLIPSLVEPEFIEYEKPASLV
jgi:1,4-dihydroxy-6-naphthoate synthase